MFVVMSNFVLVYLKSEHQGPALAAKLITISPQTPYQHIIFILHPTPRSPRAAHRQRATK